MQLPWKIALMVLSLGFTQTLGAAPEAQPKSPIHASLQAIKKLPGRVSVFVSREGRELAGLYPDTPLGVASSFKLLVLQLIVEDIAGGKYGWRDVAQLRPEHKSIPTGFLHTWPDDSWLTIESLAALMISRSDNAATDILMGIVGRDRLESLSPRNRPFLSTRELFTLKAKQNKDLLARYMSFSTTGRANLLPQVLARPQIKPSDIPYTPQLALEWFFTTRELCTLMDGLAALPLMGINPGGIDPKEWSAVGFKGGNEAGVVNLTTFLEHKNGSRYCISATWNYEKGVSPWRFGNLYKGLVNKLK
jgi:beta-lactamase class A